MTVFIKVKSIVTLDNMPSIHKMCELKLSDSYPAFFLLIATTSNKNF